MNTEIKDEFERLYVTARSESFAGRTGYTVELLERLINLAESHEELMQREEYEHAHRNLALCYHDLYQHWKAVEHFRCALELGTKEDGPLYRQYGRSLFLNNEHEQAIAALKKALEFDEEDDEARYFLCLAYAEAGKRAADSEPQFHYKSLAQKQCDRIAGASPFFAGILQGRIDS